MKKVFLMLAFAGLVGSVSASVNFDDKDKGKKECKKKENLVAKKKQELKEKLVLVMQNQVRKKLVAKINTLVLKLNQLRQNNICF